MIYDGTGLGEGGTGWYLVVLGQNNLVLLGIKWYCVHMGLQHLYILKRGDLGRCHHGGTDKQTNKQTRKDRATQPLDN